MTKAQACSVLCEWPAADDIKTINCYDPISEIFDEVMGIDFVNATYPFKRDTIQQHLGRAPRKWLDLGCGSGLFVQRVASDGVHAVGIDASPGLLSRARKRVRDLAVTVDLIEGDMLSTEFPGQYDVVTMNFDVLNQVHSLQNRSHCREHWARIFGKVFAALGSGGVLHFDINTVRRLEHDWATPEVISKRDLLYLHFGLPLERSGTSVYRKTPMLIFKRKARGSECFRRFSTVVEHFAIPNEEVCEMLVSVGFLAPTVREAADIANTAHVFLRNREFFTARRP